MIAAPDYGRELSRRAILRAGATAAGGLVLGGSLIGLGSEAAQAASSAPTTASTITGDQALAQLMAGNRRFVSGHAIHAGRYSVKRVATAEKQTPFAVILSCADSRVPPEIIFDQNIGDVFVVRVAGNTGETPIVQGSIEYGIEHLHAVLIMVLGHQSCGAVAAAIAAVQGAPPPEGQIGAFVAPVIPAAQAVQSLPQDQQLDVAIAHNVANQVVVLQGLQPLLAPEIASGKVKLVGAEYQLTSGQVKLLGA
jgi:carbonic anhydrase